MKLETIHQEFLADLDSAFDNLSSREQADELAASFSHPGASGETLGSVDPALWLRYLPVVLEALLDLIKKLQSA